MRCATASYFGIDPRQGVATVGAALEEGLEGPPDWILITHTVAVRAEPLCFAARDRWPQAALHLVSSFGSTVDEAGLHRGPSLTVFGLRDRAGAYGAAFDPLDGDIATDSAAALNRAIHRAGRVGEAPSMVFLTPTPGLEEEVLVGVQRELGPDVPIIGGSAADDTIEGEWSIGDGEMSGGRGLAVSVVYPKRPPRLAFSSGYLPTGRSGTVTAADGRTIFEIDGEPASDVYNRWTNGALEAVRRAGGGSILAESTLQPLGRRVRPDADGFLLSHPASMEPGGAMGMFANARTSDVVHLMTGTVDGLVARASHVAEMASARADHVAGGLLVYCAGCMTAVGDRFEHAQVDLCDTFGAPFSGLFSFGEQGPVEGAGNQHGNLMISAVVFQD